MGVYEDTLKQLEEMQKNPKPVAPVQTNSNNLSADLFQQTEEATKLEEPKQGAVAGFVEGLWGVAKAAVDWVGDKKDHWIDNEDEDLGVTDWKKFKQIDDDIKTGKYNQEQVYNKLQEAKKEGVISEEYFEKQRRDANSVAEKATSEQELEQKIKKDLYSQLAEFYSAESGDQTTTRILNQAIETQTDTYMDYYRRISSSDDEFDKEKYYSELATFMDKGKGFIKNYAESVMATRDNQQAYKDAEEKNKEFIKEMDNWNTKLTTSSKLASLRGAAYGLVDGEFDGIGGELGNLWGTGTGILGAVTNLISITAHEGKKLAGFYNSGYEELGIDYIAKPTDSWSRTAYQTLRQGGREFVDGFDTFLEVALPLIPITKLGLLSKVENAAKLTKSGGFGAKAASYGKTFGIQMFQDAVYFDNAFQAFSQRGTNEQDREFNVLTNLAFNGVFTLLLSKPILQGSKEFRAFIESTGRDAQYFANTPDVIEAINKGDIKTAEAGIRRNLAAAQAGEDVPELGVGVSLVDDKARKAHQSAINKISREMASIIDEVDSDEAIKAQKNFNIAMSDRSSPTIYQKSEAKLTRQEKTYDETINTLLSNKATNGKYTFAAMNATPEAFDVIKRAIDMAVEQSRAVAGSKLEMTDDMANKFYTILLSIKQKQNLELPKKLTALESQHMLKIAENITDIIKETPDVSKIFPADIIIPAKLTTKKAIIQTLSPSYEEMSEKLRNLDVPATPQAMVANKIDKEFSDVHILDTMFPDNMPEFATKFRDRLLKNFGDIDSGEVNLEQVKVIMDELPTKKYITDKELDALKLYHFSAVYSDYSQLKAITLNKDVTDKKLFESHPFFSLFTRDEENKRWIPNAVLKDARNIEEAIGQLFIKSPVAQTENLALFKYVLKDAPFKATLLKEFKNIATHTSQESGEHMWTLTKYLYMNPSVAIDLEKQFIADKEVGKILLNSYISGVVAKNPILEGAYYASWLSKIPAKPFYSSQPYADYAKNFEAYINDVVLKELPSWMDKKKLINIMYAKGLDEIVKLNQIDYDLGLEVMKRNSATRDIKVLDALKKSMSDETIGAFSRANIQERINLLESSLNTKFTTLEKPDTPENMRRAFKNIKADKEFINTYSEVSSTTKVSDAIATLVNSTTAPAFEKARKNLIKEISSTTIRGDDYLRVQQFLMIPKSLIEKGRANYLETLSNGNILDISLYTKGVISKKLLEGTSNIEEAYARLQDIVSKYKNYPSINAERKIVYKDRVTNAFNDIPAKDIIDPKPIKLSQLKGKRGIIIIGRSEMDILNRGEIIPGVIPGGNFQFMTLWELQSKLSPDIKSGYDITNPEQARKFYANFRETKGDFYITKNALENYSKKFKAKQSVVEKDTNALDLIKTNFPDSKIQTLPLNISLREDKKHIDMFVTNAKDREHLFALRDTGLLFKETIDKVIDPVLKKDIFSKPVVESFLTSGVSGGRAIHIFDELFKNSSLSLFWSTIKKDISNKEFIDLLKYGRGSDFEEKYAEHVALFKDIVEKKFPGSSEYSWFLDAFQMSDDEFLDYSRAHLLANDTGKTKTSFKSMFGSQIVSNALNKLVDIKSPKNLSIRKFITFNILNTLMRAGYTVPKMEIIDLLRLVDKMDNTTVATIGDAGRLLLNAERLKSAVYKTDMQSIVAKIEQSLKYDTSLSDKIGNWGLVGDSDMSKIVDKGESFADGIETGGAKLSEIAAKADTSSEVSLADRTKAWAAWEDTKPGSQERIDVETMYAKELGLKDEVDEDLLDPNLGYSSSGDYYDALPNKLENADTISVFEGLARSLQTTYDDITSTLYLKRFNEYSNLDRGKNFMLDKNKDILSAYENLFNARVDELFVDTNKYIINPLDIDKDFKTVDFFVSLGNKNIKITSKDDAKKLIMEHWLDITKATETERGKLMMNFYAIPKDSPLKPDMDGYLKIEGVKNFIDLSEISHVDSFVNGGKTFKNSPLYKWAFSKEILEGNNTFLGLTEDWMFNYKKIYGKDADFQKALEIYNAVKKSEGIDVTTLDNFSLSMIDDSLDNFTVDIYENGKIARTIPDPIVEIQPLSYRPTIAITNQEGKVRIEHPDTRFTRDTDVDNYLNNYSKAPGEVAEDITSPDEVMETGKLQIVTKNGYTYIAEGDKINKIEVKETIQEVQVQVEDEWMAFNGNKIEEEFDRDSGLYC